MSAPCIVSRFTLQLRSFFTTNSEPFHVRNTQGRPCRDSLCMLRALPSSCPSPHAGCLHPLTNPLIVTDQLETRMRAIPDDLVSSDDGPDDGRDRLPFDVRGT